MARSCLAIFLLLCLLSSLFLFSCSEQVPENSSTPEQNGTLEPEPDAADVIEEEDDSPEEDEPRVPPEEENPASDFTWQTGEGNTVTITKYVGTDTTVVVPAQISGKDVVEIGHAAFAITEIESIFLPDSIITIGPFAFSLCTSLEKVVLPSTIKDIKNMAFSDCYALSYIELPKGIEYIGDYAFRNCVALKSIFVPNTLKTWWAAFARCGLETVVLEEGLDCVSMEAFRETNLKEITLPFSVKTIYASAFFGCKNLKWVYLNEGLACIEISAFYDCGIEEITIPSSVTEITCGAFELAKDLKKVMFEGDAPKEFGKRYVGEKDLGYDFTVYYHKGAKGFTSPEWNGFQTEIW